MKRECTDPTGFLVKHFDIDPRFANRIPRGWTGIVFHALKQIKGACPDIKFGQVKEKFGGLRIYCDWPKTYSPFQHSIIRKLIEAAEEECSKHCEMCGTDQKVETRNVNMGWIATICDCCLRDEREKRHQRDFCWQHKKIFDRWKEEQKEKYEW